MSTRHALLMELTAGGVESEMTVNKAISLLEQVDATDQGHANGW
ncbi:MAG TPA: hypothetical protein VLA54_00750 [Acidimicrobiia bacterium]|nr:hypothetical protein [Acidimicrobiia bacterium]